MTLPYFAASRRAIRTGPREHKGLRMQSDSGIRSPALVCSGRGEWLRESVHPTASSKPVPEDGSGPAHRPSPCPATGDSGTISVVIPAKNRADVLARAILSVVAQTVPVEEVVVVDDGSTDDTPAVVEALAREHGAVKLIRQAESRGAPAARNRGAEESRGDLIALLDSDDVWKPEKIERQSQLLARHPSSPAAFCGIEFIYTDRPTRVIRTPPLVTREDLFARNVLGGSSSALVRRDAWMRVGGFEPDMPSCQDWDFWLRLARLGPLVAVPAPLVEYHFDAGERISHDRNLVEAGHQRIFRMIERDAPPDRRRLLRAQHAARLAEIYAGQCYDPLRTVGKAIEAIATGRSLDASLRAGRAVASMMLHSLSRLRSSGARSRDC